MARARNIKPAFFKNEILAELDPLDRLAFAGLWTLADFKGCLEYRPKRIKAEILPYDDCDIVQILSNLDQSGFIRIYSVQGREYIKVLGFTDHQHPHKNEIANGSNIPDYNQQAIEIKEEIKKPEKIGTSLELNGTNPPDSFNPITDSLNPINNKSETLKIPYQLIADAYNDHFAKKTGNASVKSDSLSDKRKKAIKRMWLSEKIFQELESWIKYFSHCADLPNMQFDAPRSEKWATWKPSFDYLLKQDALEKAREGRL